MKCISRPLTALASTRGPQALRLCLLANLAALSACSGPIIHKEGLTPAPLAADRAAWLSTCEDWDEWDKSAPPYRIHGQTFYVGTCGISSVLVDTEQGLVLFDSGTELGSRVVEANLAKLGYRMSDVDALIVSHEHFDHVGGMARLQKLSGATVYTGAGAVDVLRSGTDHPRDPQAGMHEPMEPVSGAIKAVGDGETLTIGGKPFLGIATPGHTIGAMSYSWESCEPGDCVTIVYADSLSPVSRDAYRFTDDTELVRGYRAGLASLAKTGCDLLLTPHPSSSDMVDRLAGDAPWVDSNGCKVYAAKIGKRLSDRLTQEAGETLDQ